MPPCPPCGNPGCERPEDNVRLQAIPKDCTKEIRPGATCFHRKRAACCEYFMGPKTPGVPGRKRKVVEVDPPDGVAVRADPTPPFLEEIDEIWGCRC